MKSSSVGSSKYRVHNSSDIHARPVVRSSRHKGDYLTSWSPASTPGPPDYVYYETHASYSQSPVEPHSPFEGGSRVIPHQIAVAHGSYPASQHAPYSCPSPFQRGRGGGGYVSPSPHQSRHSIHSPPLHSPPRRQHSSSSHLRSHTHPGPFPIDVPSHRARSIPPPEDDSQLSDISQYSLSKYKPTKPRFRIEQEGQALVVLPPQDITPPEAPSSPPSPLPQIEPPPPKRWPPSRYQTDLSEHEAREYIANGAPKYRGELREIPNGPRGRYHFFAFAGDDWDEETDTAQFQSDSFGDMSSSPEGKQTDALERPAMGHAFGIYPGTITLAYYVAGFGSELKGAEIAARGKVRKLTMLYVLDRLRTLQLKGIEEDVLDLHNHLYENLLYDNHKYNYPERAEPSFESQIDDLVAALCRPSWVDFSSPENQTIAKFLASEDPTVSNKFFHQLLLSIELYLRTSSRGSSSKSLTDIPEKIRWDLMLAQRWLENAEIEPPRKMKGRGEQKSSVGFRFPNKKNQIEALRNFGWTLKWPNMLEVEETLKYSEEDNPTELLEDRSANCMSWFTGLLLPGKSMPFILMNALINCDGEPPVEFHNLSQTVSNIGFQYRGCTYWSWECIVGKVLGAAFGVTQIAGWIGPCSASADLGRSEVAKINQAPPRCNRLSPSAIRNMAPNSDPVGPRQESYPIADYLTLTLGTDDPVDSIRIERLNFTPATTNPKGIHRQGLLEDSPNNTIKPSPIIIFDASITFAITVDKRARSWKVSLRHDTPFIAAYPCQNGPHVLFADYQYRNVRVDDLVEIQNWGSSGGRRDSDLEDSEDEDGCGHGDNEVDDDVEEVLVIQAFGVPDNEVFARAWCSFWGLPSVTADVSRTCVSCAIREAYAALVSVVILVDRGNIDVEIEEVDRLMENL